MSTKQKIEIYYQEPRLEMSTVGRLLVRVVVSASYGLLGASAIILALSDIRWLQSLGALLTLFLIDRALHIGKSEKSLAKLGETSRVNGAGYFTPRSYRLIETAYEKSAIAQGNFILEMLRLLTERREIQAGLKRMDVPLKDFLGKIDEYLKKPVAEKRSKEDLRKEISFLATAALSQALASHSAAIEPKDLFAALTQLKDKEVVKIMQLFNVSDGDLENALIFSRLGRGLGRPKRLTGFVGRAFKIRHRTMNRAWTARPTPFLDRVSVDLTDLARAGVSGFLIGHDKEYDQLVDILSRPGNPNALLIGEVGSGKETILGHLAFEMAHDRVPPPLFDRRLVSLSLGSLAAGAAEGELEGRVQRIIDEIMSAGNVILYIPDIHNLVKTGGLQITAADILIPAIRGTAFSVVGATYPREYKQYIEPNSEFTGAFETVRVNEIGEAQAVRFLVYESLILEREYDIIISFKAIKQAVMLAHKYFRQKLLPGSAEDLLKEVLADAVQKNKQVLAPEDVISIAERRVNIPLHRVQEAEAQKLLDLEKIIHERLIDQDEAVKAVAQAMREYRSGLARRGGPIASFLFVGPTGVGKTELAKILTQIQFGDQKLMLRFDMSEYQDKQSIFRFIGSPDGNVRGNLTDAVLEKPYSLILLDEFEKAHPDILNLFLQVFDDGRLTDNLGRTVDFQNTIIIATSNAHSEFIKSEIEKGAPVKEITEQLRRKLTDYFKPELLNRFSGIIVFKNLAPADIEAIARIQLHELAGLLKENQGIDLEFEEPVVKKIAAWGYDPVYGARPLRRVISDKIRAQLAEKILRKEISRGSNVKVVLEGEELKFINN